MAKSFPFSQTFPRVFDLRKTASLFNARSFRSADMVRLIDSTFLAVGGTGGVGVDTSAEVIVADGSTSFVTGSLAFGRTDGYGVVMLGSFEVLVAGDIVNQTRAETYNYLTQTWTTRANCTARYRGGIIQLGTGDALFFGGLGPGNLNTAQIYNTIGHTWSSTGNMVTARSDFGHPIALPFFGSQGQVFVCGGNSVGVTANAEMYDTFTGTWTAKTSMTTARQGHDVVMLQDGRIMVAGGTGAVGFLASCEIYDPTFNSWTSTGSLNVARNHPKLLLLPSGRVIAIGGSTGVSGTSSHLNVPTEIWDPVTGTWELYCNAPLGSNGYVDGLGVGLLFNASGDAGVIVAGGESQSGFFSNILVLKDVEPLTGLTDALTTIGAGAVTLVGSRSGPVQEIKRLRSSGGNLSFNDTTNAGELDISVNFPADPTYEDASLSQKFFDWTVSQGGGVTNFFDLKQRWRKAGDDIGTVGWTQTVGTGISPTNLNVGGGALQTTQWNLRNDGWTRARIGYTWTKTGGTGSLKMYIYSRVDPSAGFADGVVETVLPLIITLTTGTTTEFVGPPMPPGFHKVVLVFQSGGLGSGEVLRVTRAEVSTIDNSEWTSFFDDFMSGTNTGATYNEMWRTLGTGSVVPSATTTFGRSTVTALGNTYETLAGAKGLEMGFGTGIGIPSVTYETTLFLSSITSVKIEAGFGAVAEDPTGVTNFTKIIYDSSAGANWKVALTGFGTVDSGIAAATGGIILRIEIGNSALAGTKFFINGQQVFTTSVVGRGGVPFVQVTALTATSKNVDVDYVSMTWLRRPYLTSP